MADAALPADGRSLAPLLRGEDPPWRSAVLLERTDRGARAFEAVRTETQKYVEYNDGESELYDLSSDPYELQSIPVVASPTLAQDLKARLEALKSCSGESCKAAEDGPLPADLPSPGGPGAGSVAYTVRPGDTLSGIAERFGASVQLAAQVTGLEDPNLIFVGQTLYVPSGSAP